MKPAYNYSNNAMSISVVTEVQINPVTEIEGTATNPVIVNDGFILMADKNTFVQYE